MWLGPETHFLMATFVGTATADMEKRRLGEAYVALTREWDNLVIRSRDAISYAVFSTL